MIRLLLLAALALPAAELRGVWVDRSSLESRDSIRDMMQNLAAANFNAAFVDVWSRGYPIWQSDVFERETGIRIDPTYKDRDVLNELIEEGRDAGIAVFPWPSTASSAATATTSPAKTAAVLSSMLIPNGSPAPPPGTTAFPSPARPASTSTT
jgi:uncharacterized lipoprotein YddW (UPF0748 family)